MSKLFFLLRIKTWILFLLFFSLFVFNYNHFYQTYISGLIYVLWICWTIAIGYFGQDLTDNIKVDGLTRDKFKFNSYFLLTCFILLRFLPMIKPGLLDFRESNFIIKSISGLIFIYGVYCFFYVYAMTSMIVMTIEHKQKVSLSGSIGHFLRLIIFPLGVIGIHPIIYNKVKSTLV